MTNEQAMQLAVGHHQAGRLGEAQILYQQILAQQPDAAAHNNLGQLLNLLGRNEEAIIELRRAIALWPDVAEPWNNLGIALAACGRGDEAIAAYRAAIALQPNHARSHSNLGNAMKASGQTEKAIDCYRRALTIDPDYAEAHSNLGALHNELGEAEEAIRCHQRAITLRPDYAEGQSNLGSALGKAGRHEEAIAAHRRAISLQPEFAQAHFNLAMELLMQGDFVQGWAEYEWRCRMPGMVKIRKNCSQPLWDGTDLGKRVLLLYAEQGLGDTIQFLRYVPLIQGRVLLEVQQPLRRLMKAGNSFGATIVEQDSEFNVHLPLMSLPLVLRKFEPISTESYIRANAENRLGPHQGLRVGLAWAGSPNHKNDRNRSIPLAKFSRLARDGVEFFSLQVGAGSQQAAQMRLTDLTSGLHDFADTAALIAELDVVISVDTAVAHLAGAMGKPVWILLPAAADFRWMVGREDSPWYPTAKLFRQKRAGDWGEVIERVAKELFRSL